MAMEDYYITMVMCMKVNGNKTMLMAKEFILLKKVSNLKEILKMIYNKVLAKKFGLKVLNTKVNMKMARNKAKENFIGLMEIITLVNLTITS